MTAVRELIFAEIERRLAAISGVAEVERMPTGDPDAFPALHIFDADQRPAAPDTSAARYSLPLLVEGYIEKAGGNGAHAEISQLYAVTVEALLTEPPMGGLAETIDEGDCRFVVATLASERRLAFSLDLSITFATARGNPAQPA